MMMRIRVLEPQDAPAYRKLRLRALREHPEAFATSYEEELGRSPDGLAERLAPGPEHVTLGAYDGDRLVGIATLVRQARTRQRHRATLAALYVAPEARGRQAGRTLLERILDRAAGWEGVTEVALAVTVGNLAARELYLRAGFVPWGIEPRGLRVGDRFHDTEWMSLRLESRPPPCGPAEGDGVLPAVRIEHVAVWTPYLERLRGFYERHFGARAGDRYVNPARRFESYFLRFGSGARLELMHTPALGDAGGGPEPPSRGYAHLALAVGSPEAVDAWVERLRSEGVEVIDGPRWTGDGYYEAVVLDPDGNRVEITA